MQQTWLTRQYSCSDARDAVSPQSTMREYGFMEMALCLAYYAMRNTLLMRHLTFARTQSTARVVSAR
jgi:hypothetical protein